MKRQFSDPEIVVAPSICEAFGAVMAAEVGFSAPDLPGASFGDDT